jgi:hypothetical protein
MMLHPEVQRKGQEEISRVCDPSQLPSYDDADSLPYVTAITLEILRWTAAGPIGTILVFYMLTGLSRSHFAGAPHYNDTDDIYNGYLIPKGSMIIMNLWSVLLFLAGMPMNQLILRCQEHDS